LAWWQPAEGSLLSSLEAPFGVLSSVLVYGERVTGRMVAGFALIFVAMVVSEAGDALRERLRAF
jgi:drug/metabolite transporter (DMT)-like permease